MGTGVICSGGNVRYILRGSFFNTKVVAAYHYDAWGFCTITGSVDGIAEKNAIRWKGQYYDTETGFYYIGGRYYNPGIRQYINCASPEAIISGTAIYGVNPYIFYVENPVNMLYNNHNAFNACMLTYDPPRLGAFELFWQSQPGRNLAIVLFAVSVGIACYSPQTGLALMLTVGGLALGLAASAVLAGIYGHNTGQGFWNSFGNYILSNWAFQTSVAMALFIVSSVACITVSAVIRNRTIAQAKKNLANVVDKTETKTLYHYTNREGMQGIIETKKLKPSLKSNNPKDAYYGNGQYLTDITPNSKTSAQLAREFINRPNQYKYTHYVEINVAGLDVIYGRSGVYVILNEVPLDLSGRIVSYGIVGGN